MVNPVHGITTTNGMISDLQQRIPIGLSSTYCMLRLNQAYQWIEQQGAFVWNITRAQITLALLSAHMDTPDNMDVGKPASIYPINLAPTPLVAIAAEIPYVPMDELANQQIFYTPAIAGLFSCYTLVNQSGDWKIRFAPLEAISAANTDYIIYYHAINAAITTPLTAGASTFPTPPAFDQTIVDIAEAEIKRLYNLTGWEAALAKAQASAALELDKYRSPKRDLAGISEQTKEVQETQLKAVAAGQ